MAIIVINLFISEWLLFATVIVLQVKIKNQIIIVLLMKIVDHMKKFVFIPFICLVLFGCDPDGAATKALEVNPEKISVYVEGTRQITANVSDASFKSQDEFYASVDNEGLVKGEHIGSTNITVSSSAGTVRVPVTIMSQYSLYPDIDYLVGKSLNDITKEFGNNYEASTLSSGDVAYSYTKPTSYVDGIFFTMSGGKCKSIVVLVPTKNTSMLTKHLLERYYVAGMQNDMYFFLNHDKDVVLALEVYSASYLTVVYMPYTGSSSSVSVNIEPISGILNVF